jgi:histidinol-phosphate aminotransferase
MHAIEYVRQNIRAMAGYVPGEQPRDGSFIKLNTNENPYPPSPCVFEAIRDALTGDRLRKYPDPSGLAVRQAAGEVLGVDPDGIIVGNGSDDILTILTRTFVPENGLIVSPTPSYLLYRSLAEIHGARFQSVPYTPDWRLPDPWPIRGASLTFLANPNSPSGTMIEVKSLGRWLDHIGGPVVIDEAYVDFADSNCLALTERAGVIVTRTLSKSYALAGIRFGYGIADPALIREMLKVKDSYNCDALSLAAATAAIRDQEYLHQTRAKILATRSRLTHEMRKLGFEATESQSNFVWCRRSDRPVKPIYEELKRRMILVRYMNYAGYGDGLRVSVGSDAEIDRLLEELRGIV